MARQRLLARPGRRRQLGRVQLRRGGFEQPGAVRAAARQHQLPHRRQHRKSQGPWDQNYQVEDSLSWFVPGKKGDHNLKIGARYNWTELRRVSQINQNGTFRFNTDLPFNAANPRTYPERLTIRIPERLRRDDDQPQRRVVRAGQVADGRQDHAEPRPALRPGDVSGRSNPGTTRCSRPARRRRSTRTTSRRASASRGSSTTTASRWCVPATASSTTARCSAPSTTPSSSRSSPRRSSRCSPTTTPIRARAAASSRPIRSWSTARS